MLPHRLSFTLLEAVLAVAILAAASIACLGVRAQAASAERRIAERHRIDRDTQAIFDLLTAGLLPPPTSDDGAGQREWRVTWLERPVVVRAERVEAANPVRAWGVSPRAERVSLVRYRVRFDGSGEEAEFLWDR